MPLAHTALERLQPAERVGPCLLSAWHRRLPSASRKPPDNSAADLRARAPTTAAHKVALQQSHRHCAKQDNEGRGPSQPIPSAKSGEVQGHHGQPGRCTVAAPLALDKMGDGDAHTQAVHGVNAAWSAKHVLGAALAAIKGLIAFSHRLLCTNAHYCKNNMTKVPAVRTRRRLKVQRRCNPPPSVCHYTPPPPHTRHQQHPCHKMHGIYMKEARDITSFTEQSRTQHIQSKVDSQVQAGALCFKEGELPASFAKDGPWLL